MRDRTDATRDKSRRVTDSGRHVTDDGRRVSRRQLLAAAGSAGVVGTAGCSLRSVRGAVQPRWEQDLTDATATGPPTATDSHVVVGGQDKRFYGFTADGNRVFSVETGGPIETRPAAPQTGGPIHVHSTDGDLYTTDLSGDRLWHVEGRSRDAWLGRRGSLLVAVDPVTETVTGYDATDGSQRFRRPGREYPVPILTDAVCAFLRSVPEGTTLTAVDPASGEPSWETEPSDGFPHVAADGDRIVTVSDATARLHRATDGTVLWETELSGDVRRPVELSGGVYARIERDGESDELLALDGETGEVVWQQSVGTRLEAITTTDESVFTASVVNDPDGGIVIRLDAFDADGTRRWERTTELSTGGQVGTLARVGTILITGDDNAIGAYDPENGSLRWEYDPESYNIGVTTADDALYVTHRSDGGLVRLPTD